MKSKLISTTIYVGIGTAVRQISGFVVYKVLALSHGPAGIAIVGQFQNFIGIFTSLSTGGVQQGVIKYLADSNDKIDRINILRAAYRITTVSSLIIGILIIFLSNPLANYLFLTSSYSTHLIFFGVLLIFFGFNLILKSALNGVSEIRRYVIANTASSLFSLAITSSAAYYLGLSAAIFCLAISESVVFFITLYVAKKHNLFSVNLLTRSIDRGAVIKLFNYSLMALTSFVLTPVITITIRKMIINECGVSDAGLWDSMMKISAGYLGIITTTLSVYYLPTLSKLSSVAEIRKELLRGYSLLAPTLLSLIFLIYLFRDTIIRILYTQEFIKMSALFAPQLLGDFFKMLSWMLSYLMLAKAMTKEFIITQVIFAAFNIIVSSLLLKSLGLIGANVSHAVLYISYFFTLLIMFRKFFFK